MVTIVMATYNGGEYLAEQLKSIENQSYSQWQMIIRDDGSTDNTLEILETFAERVPQLVEIKVNSPASGSAKNNFAELINDAVFADYLMFADQDDVWKNDKIERTLHAMKKMEQEYGTDIPLLVHGDVEVVDEDMTVIAPSMFKLSHIPAKTTLAKLLVQNNVTGCTMMFNKNLTEGICAVANRDEVIMHDYFAALYASVFGEVGVIEETLMSYRQHGDNSVGAKDNNNAGYLLKRLSDGKQHYRDAMEKSRNQVSFFLEAYGGKIRELHRVKEEKIMVEYARLGDRGFWGRKIFYIKNRSWKMGTVRKIMQFLWG